MEKLNKNEKLALFWIILIYLGIALVITHGQYVFGSEIDWGYQHFAFPEYFRMLFYKTHDLFPDFALNIGGGQNIYYFAYYGLLSPIILISYLLPFVPMSFYISFSSLILGVISIYLFYKWIKGFCFSSKLCFILTLLFAMAGPLLFHSHRHVMFVNYMPFLLIGLIGVRRYFNNGFKGLIMISVFLMIMTSYYYSVGGILCLTLYGIYEYLRTNQFTLKDFIKKGCSFALLIIVGIMMASVILLPVIYALKNGRAESVSEVSLLEAFIPSINLDFLLYKPYSVGLIGISFIAIIYLIFMKKENRFLGICLSLLIICPVFVYILNGALYLDGKALIPFLPLYVLAIGLFLKELLENKVNLKIVLLTIIISLTWIYLEGNKFQFYFTLECIFIILMILLYRKFHQQAIVFVPLGLVSVGICLGVNLSDTLISMDEFGKENDLIIKEIMRDISKEDDGVFRTAVDLNVSSELVNHVSNINQNLTTLYSSTYNTLYSDFYYSFNNNRSARNMFITGENGNILFESYMGVKYLITDKKAPLGYKLFKNYGDYKVYINENTLPLGYVTDRIMSIKDYNKLNFPDDSLALIGNVIAKEGDYHYESTINDVAFDLYDGVTNNLKIENYKDGYKVTASKNGGSIKLKINGTDRNVYMLRFTVEKPQSCLLGDTCISVNGIKNKLTCKTWKYFNNNYTFDYTLSNFNQLDIHFSEGTHYIKKAVLYSLNYDDLLSNLAVTPFEISEASGDILKGKINVLKDGYFNLSIPYDKGFIIKVDDKEVEYEKVNNAFIGFFIEKGTHRIEIEFKAPNALVGKVVSVVGIICFVVILIYDRRKKLN